MNRIFQRVTFGCLLAVAASPLFAATVEQLKISDCWIRAMPRDLPSAGYFKVRNSSDKPVDLETVSTEAFSQSMIHQTNRNARVATMSMVEKVSVPADGAVAFAPGGYHVMFEKARQALAVGSTIPVVFGFSGGAEVEAQCVVRNASGQ